MSILIIFLKKLTIEAKIEEGPAAFCSALFKVSIKKFCFEIEKVGSSVLEIYISFFFSISGFVLYRRAVSAVIRRWRKSWSRLLSIDIMSSLAEV